MGRRASRTVKSGPNGMLVAAFSVALLALTLLLAVPARAQDISAQAGEATIVVVRDQQVTKQTSQTTAAAGQNKNTVTSTQVTSSSETAQVVQEGGQQAQADTAEEDSRAATDPTEETARITESDADTDEIVDRIVVPAANCEEDNNASVVVEDDDGTRVRLTDGGNVTISVGADAITIEGTDAGGNLDGINASGGDDPQFGTEGETVVGEVVGSTGITCGRDADATDTNNTDTGATATTDDVTATAEDGDATATTDDVTATTDDARADDDLQNLSCAELLVLFRSEGGQYGDASRFSDAEVRAQVEVCLENEIVKGTAADGDLPDTGGLSLIGLAVLGVASAAAGLSVIRGGRR